jgi:hypothetical protein
MRTRTVRGQTGGQREHGEQGQAGDEYRPGPDPVGEHATGQAEHREQQRVTVDHPLQPGQATVKVTSEGRQRDRGGGVVEQHKKPHHRDHG